MNRNVPEHLQSVPPQSAQERAGGSPSVGLKAVRSKRFGMAGPSAGKCFCPYWKGTVYGGRFLPADPARRRHAGAGAPVVRLRRKACRMYGWRRHPVWPTPERKRLGDASSLHCSTRLGCGNREPGGFSGLRLSVAPVRDEVRRACPAGERFLFGGAHIVQNVLQTLIRQAAGTDDHAFHGDGPP